MVYLIGVSMGPIIQTRNGWDIGAIAGPVGSHHNPVEFLSPPLSSQFGSLGMGVRRMRDFDEPL